MILSNRKNTTIKPIKIKEKGVYEMLNTEYFETLKNQIEELIGPSNPEVFKNRTLQGLSLFTQNRALYNFNSPYDTMDECISECFIAGVLTSIMLKNSTAEVTELEEVLKINTGRDFASLLGTTMEVLSVGGYEEIISKQEKILNSNLLTYQMNETPMAIILTGLYTVFMFGCDAAEKINRT